VTAAHEIRSELGAAETGWDAVHDRAVANLAERVALALGFSPVQARQMYLAGLLHDVGKREIPREILDKPGPLNSEEWSQVMLHPILGQQILLGEGMTDLATWVRSHHEHFDGAGYPDGLAGDEIPLESRILAVADAYHAMTSERPYSAPLSVDEAATEMRSEAGAQFDPAVVEALLGSLGHTFSCRPSRALALAA
jgi:HD-GYP domain-containing protein (c-di-GMP phosphodiesterase class II)